MKRSTVLTAAVALAAASPLLLTTSSNAAPVAAAPAGCTDILPSLDSSNSATGTQAKWDRLVRTVTQETKNEALGLYGPATVTYQSRGVADAFFALAAPACTDVTYVATITDQQGTTTYGTVKGAGDGVSKVLHVVGVIDGTDAATVGVRLSTVDSRGRTIDTLGNGPVPATITDDDGTAGANFA